MVSDARIVAETILAGRYRLVRIIDRGGMAEVWEGRDETLDRPVAVKVLHPKLAGNEEFQERFRLEAVAAARLSHPNIVSTYDTGLDEGPDGGSPARRRPRSPIGGPAVDTGTMTLEAAEQAAAAQPAPKLTDGLVPEPAPSGSAKAKRERRRQRRRARPHGRR